MIGLTTKALRKSDEAVALVLKEFDSVGDDDLGRLLVNVMVEGEDVRRPGLGNNAVALLHGLGPNAPGIARIEVPKSEVLSTHSSNIADHVVVGTIGRASKGGGCTSYLSKGLFHQPELMVEGIPVHGGEISMAPSVGSNLVTLVERPLDALDLFGVVDASPIVPIEEEGSLSTGSGDGFPDVIEIDPRTVVEGEGDGIRLSALGDDLGRGALEQVAGRDL